MKEKTTTWLAIAESDLDFAKSILKNNNRPFYAVHFCHQAIEKILKAIVQELTSEDPKRTHNFKILSEQAGLTLPVEIESSLQDLAPHYLASKYPEDMQSLYRVYTEPYATKLMAKTEEMFLWFKEQLTSVK